MISININLEENKIYVNSNYDIGMCRVTIYDWNPYTKEETVMYFADSDIQKDINYWYLTIPILKNSYGIIIRVNKNDKTIKEENFRLKSIYGYTIKSQAIVFWGGSGIGDNLFITPIIKKLYNIYNRKITLYTYFPEVFINNPYLENVIKIEDIDNLNINTEEYEVHHIGHSEMKPFNVFHKYNPDVINLLSQDISLKLNDDEKYIDFFPDNCEIPELPKIYIVINPNKTDGPRTWGTENYNKLIKMLENEKIFVVALGKDVSYTQFGVNKNALTDINITYGLNLINSTTLSQAWNIINNSAGFVSHTSGLFNLAMSTNARIFELGSNCAFSTWITKNKKNVEIEGKCKLHCYHNDWCCVSEHTTINNLMPTYLCHLDLPTYECHPTPGQVFNAIITKLKE